MIREKTNFSLFKEAKTTKTQGWVFPVWEFVHPCVSGKTLDLYLPLSKTTNIDPPRPPLSLTPFQIIFEGLTRKMESSSDTSGQRLRLAVYDNEPPTQADNMRASHGSERLAVTFELSCAVEKSVKVEFLTWLYFCREIHTLLDGRAVTHWGAATFSPNTENKKSLSICG